MVTLNAIRSEYLYFFYFFRFSDPEIEYWKVVLDSVVFI